MAVEVGKLALIKNADGYDEVAARLKPSAEALWDLPTNTIVEVLDDWTEVGYLKHKGFIKSKNLPNVALAVWGSSIDVKDSYPGNLETCMRRHAEQDATKGNVLCYVPNGVGQVQFRERWIEFKWKKHRGFVKARHIQPAPAGAEAGTMPPVARGAAAAPAKRGIAAVLGGRGGVVPEAKKPRVGAEGGASSSAEPAPAPAKDSAEGAGAEAAKEAGGASAAAAATEAGAAATTTTEATPAAATEGEVAKPKPEEAPTPMEGVVEAPAAGTAAPAAPTAPSPAPAPPAAAPAAPAAGANKDCDCCFDNVPMAEGACCPSKAHFFCGTCLGGLLTAFKTADYAEQKKGKGRVLCPMKDSDTPFGDAALAAFVAQDIFDEYLEVRIKVAEKGIQEQMEKENNDKIADLKEKLAKATGSAEQLEIDKHRLRIIDDIFTLKCPRCKLAFLDYDGCSAVTCGGCKAGFCSYCLEDCGADAHGHFYANGSKCPKEGGPIFVEHAQWLVYQQARKARELMDYLLVIPEDIRQKVCDSVAPDAKDLGIVIPKDLTTKALEANISMILDVPRTLRERLTEFGKKKLEGKDAVLDVPMGKKVPVRVPPGGVAIAVTQAPLGGAAKKVIHLAAGREIEILDEWVEANVPSLKLGAKVTGMLKARHVVGRPDPKAKCKVKEANGNGSTMVRRTCKPDEGKNVLGYVDDDDSVTVVNHWIQFKTTVGKAVTGFVPGPCVATDDVVVSGNVDDVKAFVAESAAHFGITWKEQKKAMAAAVIVEKAGAAGAPPKGKGRGRGRGRGRG